MRSEGEDNDFRAIGELQYSKFSHGSEGPRRNSLSK